MTVSELKRILEAEGFRQDVYSLTGGLPNEAYCLENRGYEWAVYYSERGERSGERIFFSESEASEFFLQRMRRDPTTKPRH